MKKRLSAPHFEFRDGRGTMQRKCYQIWLYRWPDIRAFWV